MEQRRRMWRPVVLAIVAVLGALCWTSATARAGQFGSSGSRDRIVGLARELEDHATSVARDTFDHFRSLNRTMTSEEQAVLFKSEEFAASCRLFARLAGTQPDAYRAESVRENLRNSFSYLAAAFTELDRGMRRANASPYGLSNARSALSLIDREFSRWGSSGWQTPETGDPGWRGSDPPDNLASLNGKYVQGRDSAVYLIERDGLGTYMRRPFKNLESLFRYNYDRNRGNDPWKYKVDLAENTLRRIPLGATIALSFEGQMIIEAGSTPNRAVYRIEGGKKRALTRPELVARYGGWGRVFQVPPEVIASYADGQVIDRQ